MIEPYFNIEEEVSINTIDELLNLNIKKPYYKLGSTKKIKDELNLYQFTHETAGIFRGQIRNWPLIPKCFRKVNLAEDFSKWSYFVTDFAYTRSLNSFRRFCERAEKQNPGFPKFENDRMSIAQHYGINTPLLDWSQNIFTAIFFAVREIYSNHDFKKDYKIYIYHIIDERLFYQNSNNDFENLKESTLVKPIYIDRRIERQKGIFSFHPHPAKQPQKIPLKLYTIKEHFILKLRDLMDGLGFTEDYFFPDYAGIAEAVKNETSL